jgi:hypothetical protein
VASFILSPASALPRNSRRLLTIFKRYGYPGEEEKQLVTLRLAANK